MTSTFRTALFTTLSAITLTGIAAAPAFAAEPATQTATKTMDHMASDMMKADTMKMETMAPHTAPFIRRNKSLKGSLTVLTENGQTLLRLSDDFRASNGPDLKIFLNPKTVANVTGATATDGALLLSPLSQTRGGHDYVLPDGVSLANYQSVLIHCEKFSVLWGGADLS